MKTKWFMISLIPAIIFHYWSAWNTLWLLRFATIYWSIVAWIGCWIILENTKNRNV